MGLQSALTTALTGLQAAETTIDVVGNNIANSNTVGFKESEAIFATQFLQSISIGSAPSTNGGGTNPRQIGLGVKVAEISPNFTQGTIEISSNPLDVAIQGDGFLVVQGGTDRFYTRNGQLKLNSANEIVTSTGQRVLGYGVNDNYELETDGNPVPLIIPLGQERVAQATTEAVFAGVLNPAVDLGADPSISRSAIFGDGTIEQPRADTGVEFDLDDFRLAEPPPTTGVVTTATNNAASGPGAGTVRYRVVLVDSSGLESAPSGEISVDNSGGAGEITFTDLPTASGSWVGRRIYRTEAGGNTFHALSPDLDASTQTFTDTIDDATLVGGATLNTDLIDGGSYSYYVTYYDPANQVETRPTARIGSRSVDSLGGRIRVDLTDLAPPENTAFTQVRIYRNLASDTSEFRRVDSGTPISINDDSFVDDVNDTTLQNGALLDREGPIAAGGDRLVDLVRRSGENYLENFFEAGTLEFAAQKDGVNLEPKTLEITGDPLDPNGPGTTLQDLVEFVRDALGIQVESSDSGTPLPTAGGVTIENGQIVITSNLGEENAIEVPLTSFRLTPTGAASPQSLSIPFTETQQADGPGTTTEMVVYDSLGLPLKIRVTTVLEEKNPTNTVYRWYASSAENEPLEGVTTVVGNGLLEFDSNGDLSLATQNRVSIQRNTTASESPLEVELDFDSVKALGQTDALNNPISSLSLTSQDGFAPGVLSDFIITDDGLIQGQFSNGTQRTIGQMLMAKFTNNSGLRQVGDSMFAVGVNSGEPIIGTPGEEGIGTLSSGAVELSNTDIGQNLIELILASTQYRSGSRVITTAQELLDELLALRR